MFVFCGMKLRLRSQYPTLAGCFRSVHHARCAAVRLRAALITLSILATATATYAQSSIPMFDRETSMTAPPGPVVVVRFVGNSALGDDELTSITATQVTSGFSRALNFLPGSIGSPYQTLDYSTLQRDTAELVLHYRDNGFLLARVNYRVSPDIEGLKAYNEYIRRVRLVKSGPGAKESDVPKVKDTVTFIIREGPPFTIAHIAVAGLESLPTEFLPELTENVTIKSGVRWSRPVAAKEVERLSNIMIEKGYPNFRFDTIIVAHQEGKTTVNVTLYFTPGHRYKYGDIHIDYDTTAYSKAQVAGKVLLTQVQLDSGSWYRFSDIQRSEQNLYKLGAFDLVRVSLDTSVVQNIPDSLRDSMAVPVQIYLRSKQRGELPIGIYGGASVDGFVVGGNIVYLNHNLTQTADYFNAQIADQPLPTSQRLYSGSIEYQIPYIGLGLVPFATGIGYSKQSRFTTNYDQESFSLHAGTNIISFFIPHPDARTSLSPDLLAEYLVTTGDPNAPPQQINLLPSLTYQIDRTNDPLNPSSGSFFSAAVEYGVPSDLFALFSSSIGNHLSSAYIKFTPQIKLYTDLSSTGKSIIAGRLRFGYTQMQTSDTERDPSLNHRYFGGGGSSNRGWPDQALVVTDNQFRASTAGGYNDIEGNIELRYAPFQYDHEYTSWQKLSSPMRVVLFYDIGNVFDDGILPVQTVAKTVSQLAQTVGIGFRYNLFFGAVRVDLGFKLYDPNAGTCGFQTGGETVIPTSRGAWLSGNPFRMGRTMNIQFGLGQAF